MAEILFSSSYDACCVILRMVDLEDTGLSRKDPKYMSCNLILVDDATSTESSTPGECVVGKGSRTSITPVYRNCGFDF